MKFYDERSSKFRYRRVAIGPGGKIAAAVVFFLCLSAAPAWGLFFGTPTYTALEITIISVLVIALFFSGIFLFMQKAVVVDLKSRKVTVEFGPLASRRTIASYDFKDVAAVVVYALTFGQKRQRNLYAAAIQTEDNKLIIFNPGVPDARENTRIAEILAGMLGVKILAGKVDAGRAAPDLGAAPAGSEAVAVPVAIVAIERNDRKEVLLIRRNEPPFTGLWGMPGGKVGSGETPEQTAKREIYEETGYALKNVEGLGMVSEKILEEGAPHAHVLIHLFRADAGEIPCCSHEEVEAELQWRSRKDIESEPSDMIPGDIRMLKDIIFPGRPAYVRARIEKTADGYHLTRFEFIGSSTAGPESPALDPEDEENRGEDDGREDKQVED